MRRATERERRGFSTAYHSSPLHILSTLNKNTPLEALYDMCVYITYRCDATGLLRAARTISDISQCFVVGGRTAQHGKVNTTNVITGWQKSKTDVWIPSTEDPKKWLSGWEPMSAMCFSSLIPPSQKKEKKKRLPLPLQSAVFAWAEGGRLWQAEMSILPSVS